MGFEHKLSELHGICLNINLEDVTCPICLDVPHNGVLLQCSSYDKGCRPFMCDTDHTHSNCLDRFQSAYGMIPSEVKLNSNDLTGENIQSIEFPDNDRPICPLCRGEVTGWIVVNEIRGQLNKKQRCCEEERCKYFGNYSELQRHSKLEHPHSRPSKIDPARQLDWENFQQSSEIVDVLSTIHSEVPHGVVLGDYVIEYGEETGDEYEDFPGDEGNWWTSCILYQVFDNFRASRNRRRSRMEARRGHHHAGLQFPNSENASYGSAETGNHRLDEFDVDFSPTVANRQTNRIHRSSRRRRSRFQDV